MATAKIFKSGKTQVLQLPNEFCFKSKEVEIFKRGNEIILREKPASISRAKTGNLERAFYLIADLPGDFDIPGRSTDHPQKRKGLRPTN